MTPRSKVRFTPVQKEVIERMRGELLEAARSGEVMTYGHLMQRYRFSRGRALSRAIGEVDVMESRAGAPGFAAIIVRKDTRLPGGGFFVGPDIPRALARRRERGSDPKLTRDEESYVRREQKTIWEFYSRDRRRSSG